MGAIGYDWFFFWFEFWGLDQCPGCFFPSIFFSYFLTSRLVRGRVHFFYLQFVFLPPPRLFLSSSCSSHDL